MTITHYSYTFPSFHFKSTGSISAAENLLLTQIQGEIIKPNYMNLQINGSYSSGLVFKTRLISHNGKSLILNPLNKKWEPASENFNPAGFFAPHKGVSKIINNHKVQKQRRERLQLCTVLHSPEDF